MFKNYITILIGMLCIISTNISAMSSSSYLIAKTAINFYDYDEAYGQFTKIDDEISESDLNYKLFVLVNLNFFSEAFELSKNILKKNKKNQEAWLFYLSYLKKFNGTENFNSEIRKITDLNLSLLDYFFYDQVGKIKNNQLIAKSILEVVKGSLSVDNAISNYNYLLYYLYVANFLDQNLMEGYFYSAQIYQSLKKYKNASKLYDKIDKDHNLYLEGQKSIAMNQRKQGLYENAERNLLNLLKNNKNNHGIIFALSEVYRLEKKYDDAIIYYTKLINSKNLKLERWKILYFRAISYERSNKWQLAEKDFMKSLKLKPNSPEVLNYLAYGWLERNINYQKAIQMLTNANKSNPDDHYILDSLAWGYFKIKKYEKASLLMEKVIDIAPGEAISLDHLGDIYFAMNRKREALYLWSQALDLSEPRDKISEELNKKISLHNDNND